MRRLEEDFRNLGVDNALRSKATSVLSKVSGANEAGYYQFKSKLKAEIK